MAHWRPRCRLDSGRWASPGDGQRHRSAVVQYLPGQQLAVRTREQRVPVEEAEESFVRFRDEVCARIGRNLTNVERERDLTDAAEMSPVCRDAG